MRNNGGIPPKHRDGKKQKSFWQRWSFSVILGLGYLSIGIVVALFLLAGANSGWSFTGDSAGGIGLVYAATIFLPHLLLFLFTLVAITIQSIIYWKELRPLTRGLVIFYYLVTALILWSNLSENGGYAVRYYTRKIFAPDYYAPVSFPEKLTDNPGLRRLLRNYDREAAAFYDAAPSKRVEHYLALNFWKSCIQDRLETNATEHYRAYRKTGRWTGAIFRSHVRSLDDAILQEKPSPFYWSDEEKLDAFTEMLAAGKDEEHPDPCSRDLDSAAIHRLIYGGGTTIADAAKHWSFLTHRNSRDLLILDEQRVLVADANRGIELWHRTSKGWRYARTLDDHPGAWRLLRRGSLLYVYFTGLEIHDRIVRYRLDPATGTLREEGNLPTRWINTFKEWDADAAGERLFVAIGYSGVKMIDFHDPRHPRRVPTVGQRIDDWSNDLIWDERRGRLYGATRRGLLLCIPHSGRLECDDPLRGYRYLRRRKRFCLVRNGTPDCNATVPPRTFRALLLPDPDTLLALNVQSGSYQARLYRYPTDERLLKTPRFPLTEHRVSFSLKGLFNIIAFFPQNVGLVRRTILLPGENGIALVELDGTLKGCLDTGKIYRFLPYKTDKILAAQGREGIREWDLSRATFNGCR